jgi:hypothetical protein
MAERTIWGVFDSTNNTWVGDSSGPKLFDNWELAQCSAQIIDNQLGRRGEPLRAKEFNLKTVRKVGEEKTIRSALDALDKIEKGAI